MAAFTSAAGMMDEKLQNPTLKIQGNFKFQTSTECAGTDFLEV
jgi:hypothetical protein